MKKMKIAALAATSLAGLIAVASAAQAQAWVELRTWSTPRVYEEAPIEAYPEAPRYGVREALPRRAVRRIVEARGFEVIGPIQFAGDSYVVPVEDRRGRVRRIVVDAHDGRTVDRTAGGPPRPPAEIGRYRDRYAAAPSTELPPLPLDPRGSWRDETFSTPVPPPAVNERERALRERYARQTPGGSEAPLGRADDLDAAPGLAPPPSPPKAAEPKKAQPQKQRATTKKQEKPATKRQAARTPAAEKPAAKADEPKPVEAAKPEPAREAAKPEPAKEASKPAAETAAAPPPAPAPKAAAPKTAAPKADTKSNASVLRRPAQKQDSASGPRTGVAEGPTVSSGAEPQRKSPRVVYPGPGAPAPAQQSEAE